jgi:hypothetical protein
MEQPGRSGIAVVLAFRDPPHGLLGGTDQAQFMAFRERLSTDSWLGESV